MLGIVYVSLTGQTRRFVTKIDPVQMLELTEQNGDQVIDFPYLLILPTYAQGVRDLVDDFFMQAGNRRNCRGLIGTGNRNFAQLFCETARLVSRDYRIPLLFELEFQGDPDDVEYVKELMKND